MPVVPPFSFFINKYSFYKILYVSNYYLNYKSMFNIDIIYGERHIQPDIFETQGIYKQNTK